MSSLLPTVIVRHPNENPRKGSVLPLRGRADILFLNYPVRDRPPLEGYIRLSADGPPLSSADAEAGGPTWELLSRTVDDPARAGRLRMGPIAILSFGCGCHNKLLKKGHAIWF